MWEEEEKSRKQRKRNLSLFLSPFRSALLLPSTPLHKSTLKEVKHTKLIIFRCCRSKFSFWKHYREENGNGTFTRGRFSALSFLTWYLILLENSLFCLFSLYLRTLASLCPTFHSSSAPTPTTTTASSCCCSLISCTLAMFLVSSGTLHKHPSFLHPLSLAVPCFQINHPFYLEFLRFCSDSVVAFIFSK